VRRSARPLGLALVVISSFLLLDPNNRIAELLGLLEGVWPWLLLGLAGLNLLRSITPTGAFIGPLAVAGVALVGLLPSLDVHGPTIANIVVPLVTLAVGAALLLRGSATNKVAKWTTILATVSRRHEEAVPGTINAHCWMGELRVDLRQAEWDEASTLNVVVVLGRVAVEVPVTLPIVLDDAGILVAVQESGFRAISTTDARLLRLTPKGLLGRVDIIRR
jgi:hypothetical protein